jgi:hypothetical protein
MKPLVSNAMNEVEIKQAEDKIGSVRQEELNDLRFILQSPQGRRFLWRVMGKCNFANDTFDTNALTQSRENGKRMIGLFLMAEITMADEESLFKMMRESKENKVK